MFWLINKKFNFYEAVKGEDQEAQEEQKEAVENKDEHQKSE